MRISECKRSMMGIQGKPARGSVHGMVIPYGFRTSNPISVPFSFSANGRPESWNRLLDTDDNEERLPPHTILAIQNLRRQLTNFSVVEGVGRTLKGRDACKMRDAVWNQIGFPG
ncbi:hypothetical protein KP509_02G107400 [Ceratopteris richardii]|uniref:Uncharacterized protein n=1 Tax=Ceratopteris richardii TaxID=49495 RepID=A0A8T2VHP6_CERRI|nr:hypothetical protein KP509_02G107400 [Ceratopteris richardii]